MNAAGGDSDVGLEKTVKRFEEILKSYKQALDITKRKYEVA